MRDNCGMADKGTGPQTHDTALTATEEIYYFFNQRDLCPLKDDSGKSCLLLLHSLTAGTSLHPAQNFPL